MKKVKLVFFSQSLLISIIISGEYEVKEESVEEDPLADPVEINDLDVDTAVKIKPCRIMIRDCYKTLQTSQSTSKDSSSLQNSFSTSSRIDVNKPEVNKHEGIIYPCDECSYAATI